MRLLGPGHDGEPGHRFGGVDDHRRVGHPGRLHHDRTLDDLGGRRPR
jgi:hypothetical protein